MSLFSTFKKPMKVSNLKPLKVSTFPSKRETPPWSLDLIKLNNNINNNIIIKYYDQREIQQLGRIYYYYPASAIIMLLLLKYSAEAILDVTYGVGRFYMAYRPLFIIGADPIKRNWMIKPNIFIQKSIFQLLPYIEQYKNRIQMIIVDPPWSKEKREKRKEYTSYTDTELPHTIILEAFKIAKKLYIPYLLYHYKTILNNNMIKQHFNFDPDTIIYFKPVIRNLSTKTLSVFAVYKNNNIKQSD